ncbi:MAG TPA: hypothetical protein VFF13_05540 [archaeon]|nr:hypothetical protein [archaeon]
MEREIEMALVKLRLQLKTASSVDLPGILSKIDDLEWEKSGKPRRKSAIDHRPKTNSEVVHHNETGRFLRRPR